MMGKSVLAHMETELYHLLSTGQKAKTEKLIFKTCDFKHCDNGDWTYLDVKQYTGRITGILYRYVQEKCPELTAQAEEAMDNIDYYMKCLNASSLSASLNILLDSLWESGEDNDTDSGSGSIMQQVEQIHKYMERSYYENITLTALAEEYHMDASYLSRSFSQKYGETIIAFLTRIRMEKARELLESGKFSVTVVAEMVGMRNLKNFSNKEYFGKTPKEFMKKV